MLKRLLSLTWGQMKPAVLGSKRSEFCYRETAAD